MTNKKFKVIDYDIIYLSYDEPNAEKNYADLCSKVPWAKRVHGVEGSDAAHKACANLSETDRFITVDGDNIINPEFLNQELDFGDRQGLENSVISWVGKNQINGLMYGNGGIKCWPKELVLNMRTHEHADPNNPHAQVDFCWDIDYIQMNTCFSEVHNNATPQQAWRAGFREGVKMALVEGVKPSKDEFLNGHWKNLNRLWIWLMVGADVKNGMWAIYGARHGLYKTMCTDWDYVNVRDFEYLNSLWREIETEFDSASGVYEDTLAYGNMLQQELDIPIASEPLNTEQSIFFKTVYQNPARTHGKFIKETSTNSTATEEYDIVMITYGEPNADENYENLKLRFPRAKRIDNVEGIHNAHKKAASICNTDMFWVVDGDAKIKEDFNFKYYVPESDKDTVHVWRCENPVNGLIYGYGGIKLLPRHLTENMDTSKPDMTTSISRHFKVVNELSNITSFNTDEFNAWRSGFRECCKLASKVIDRQKNNETEERLNIWCTIGADKPFGEYAIAGAIAGRKYGEEHKGDLDALKKINDFNWLMEKFNEC